jgi:hypothetical protein
MQTCIAIVPRRKLRWPTNRRICTAWCQVLLKIEVISASRGCVAVARVSNSSCKSCLGPGLGFSQAILGLIYFCEHAYKGGSRQQGVDSWIHYHSFIHSAFIPSIIGQSSIRRSKLLYSVFCILISNQYG